MIDIRNVSKLGIDKLTSWQTARGDAANITRKLYEVQNTDRCRLLPSTWGQYLRHALKCRDFCTIAGIRRSSLTIVCWANTSSSFLSLQTPPLSSNCVSTDHYLHHWHGAITADLRVLNEHLMGICVWWRTLVHSTAGRQMQGFSNMSITVHTYF